MKNLLKKTLSILAVLLVLTATMSLVACAEKDGPLENAGEKLDDAIDDTGDAFEDAGEKLDEAIDDTGDALEDAGEEIEDAVDGD